MTGTGRAAANRQALLARLLAGRQAPVARDAPVRLAHLPEPLPLAPAQERIWFADQLAGTEPVFTLSSTLRTALPYPAFQRRARDVIARHAALRTRVSLERDGPVARLRDAADFTVAHRSLTHLDPAAADAVLADLVESARRHRFDTAAEWLLRMTYVDLPAGDNAVVLMAHHLIGDGIATSLLVADLLGRPRPAAAIDYPDFAVWERLPHRVRRREHQVRQRAEALAGAPLPAHVIPDLRPPEGVGGLLVERVTVPDPLVSRVRDRARTAGCTEAVLLLTAWVRVLTDATAERDLVIGMPVTGREQAELATVVGPFTNLVPLRVRVPVRAGTDALLQICRQAVADGLRCQEAPLTEILAALYGSGAGSGTMLGVLFNCFRMDPTISEFPLPGAPEHPLALEVFDTGVGLPARIVFDAGQYRPETVRALGERFVAELSAACRAMGRPAVEPADTGNAHNQLTGGTAAAPGGPGGSAGEPAAQPDAEPAGEPGLDLLTAIAAAPRTDPVAVTAGDTRLTVTDLVEQARALALGLRRHGLTDGAPVAVTIRRHPAAVVALAGVLAARGSYVPLPPDLPDRRRATVLAMTRSGISLHDDPDQPGRLRIRRLDGGDDPPRPGSGWPASGGYCIFTSGSTGQPKGVVVPTGALRRHLDQVRDRLGLTPADRCLQFAGHGFDAWIEQTLAPLLAGATVVMRGDQPWDPLDFGKLARTARLTVANVPTPWFNGLSAAGPEQWMALAQSPLRLVIPGGDEISPPVVESWHRWMPAEVELVNAYGPTETVVTATWARLNPEPGVTAARCPIGRPVPGRQAYVYNDGLRPLGPGQSGELWLGGLTATGYLDDPRLTALRFVPDPLAARPGDRMYRTGDVVRVRPDRQVEFLRRRDAQVKILGLRFELAEVERALTAHPAIEEAAVVVCAEPDRHLVAWVTSRQRIAPATVRAFVARRLPAPVVPRRVEVRDRLPRTDGGKVDRRTLQMWSTVSATSDRPAGDPGHPIRAHLVAWFSQLIGVPATESDDFFALGGNSLLAVRLAARCRERLGADVDLRTVFEARTPAALADRLATGTDRPADEPAAPRSPRPGRRTVLTPAQLAFWVGYRTTDATAYMVPIALRISGALNLDALVTAVTEVLGRHETLRCAIQEDHDGVHAIVLDVPADTVRRWLHPVPCPDEAALTAAVEADTTVPIDLRDGPLRMALYRRDTHDHVLYLAIHHVACDGRSVGNVVRELLAGYAAHRTDDPPRPPDAVQYTDVAAELAAEAATRSEPDLAYWRTHLDGVEDLAFPNDEPVAGEAAQAEDHLLDDAVGPALTRLAREHGTTPFTVALAAWQLAVARWTGQDAFAVGIPVTLRSRSHHDDVVGPLINTVAVRATTGRGRTVRRYLEDVQHALVNAYQHRHLPFAEVVDRLRVGRTPDHPPVYQTMVTTQDLRGDATPGEVRIHWWQLPPAAPQLPLSLYLLEDGGGLTAVVRYARNAVDARAVRRLGRMFTHLVTAGLTAPDRVVSAVDALGEEDRGHLLDLGRGAPLRGAPVPVPERIRRWARTTPASLAVRDAHGSLTFAQLDEAVTDAAAVLAAAGVRAADRVGVCVTRGTGLVVATLAVLRVGATYVPLDPAYPPDRLARLARIARPTVTVVAESTAHVAASVGPVVELKRPDGHPTSGPEQPTGGPGHPTEPVLAAEDAAYLIFTSGSTGEPKGVLVEHRALTWLFDALTVESPWQPSDVQVTTCRPVFDVSVMELLLPLASGAMVELHEPGAAFDPHEFGAVLKQAGATRLFATPTLWAQLADATADLRGLHGMSAGEPLPAELARTLIDRGVRLWNGYGPTETTVVATGATVPVEELDLPVVALGRPLPGVHVYVLDRWLRPAPTGTPGEIYLSGDCLARGYHEAPGQTAARFVADPHRPGTRMYRTGDRARWLADGRLEFLGRRDDQVKMLGYRVELGEVDACLMAHPSVRAAATVLHRTDAGRDRLAAFVEARPPELSPDEVRRWAVRWLPGYMVPAMVVVVSALPTTAGGKIDKRALRRLADDSQQPAPAPAAPRDAVERLVAEVWADILAVDTVGLRQSFFDIGGDSVAAIQVMSRLSDLAGAHLPVSMLFEAQTVDRLVEHLRERMDPAYRRLADAAGLTGGGR